MIFSLGIDQLTVSALKDEGFEVVPIQNMPDLKDVSADEIYIISSEVIPLEGLGHLRESYVNEFLFLDTSPGIRNWQTRSVKCAMHNIHYLSSRATVHTIADKLNILSAQVHMTLGRVIGFFGTGFSSGVTSVSKLFATRIASTGKKVIHLGLDLYDPGWNEKTHVSIDQWRPKLTAKVIGKDDFQELPKHEGVTFLPGNFDFLSAQDFSELEIEYLLQRAQDEYEIVVADFGSICDSAAWYVGIQRSAIRTIVAHPDHTPRFKPLEDVVKHLDLALSDFFLVVNRQGSDRLMKVNDEGKQRGMQLLLELPNNPTGYLSPGKREIQHIDSAVKQFMVGLGYAQVDRKFGGIL